MLQGGQEQGLLWDAPDIQGFTPHNIQHPSVQIQAPLCPFWTQNEPGHFPDVNG